jgi:hypothetical protein
VSPEKHAHDDELVIAYLLGAAPQDETERLDELSIVDDEFALRLSTAENGLVDAYVRGELSGERLTQFQNVYLATPKRRQKVAFAKSLVSLAGARGPVASGPKRPFARFPQWAIAAAACVVLIAGGLELYRMSRPLPQPPPEQRPEAKVLPSEPPPSPAPAPRSTITAAIVLLPQTRGAASIATLKLPPETDSARFRLELESDDFPGYRAALRNPATNQFVWRSGTLKSRPRGQTRAVSVNVPSSLLQPRNYTLELTGAAASGATEFIGSYAFRVEK